MDNFRCMAAAEKEFLQFAQSSQHETLFLSKINVHTLVDILICRLLEPKLLWFYHVQFPQCV